MYKNDHQSTQQSIHMRRNKWKEKIQQAHVLACNDWPNTEGTAVNQAQD